MYHSVVKVKKIVGFSFSKLSFKVVSVYSYMLPQISDMPSMFNKNPVFSTVNSFKVMSFDQYSGVIY